ncbi:hypothetical protein CCR75_003002 [Bremia lactucae]|uniref:Glycoside hydrolase family 19 catalytic domain-containing protein n=1 Tax=Bremia lactucae TaxID=4779 RepID=A0A976FF90_BRELC|nr:hypothetical protein CCR75_003002 [Bremia lactucae]
MSRRKKNELTFVVNLKRVIPRMTMFKVIAPMFFLGMILIESNYCSQQSLPDVSSPESSSVPVASVTFRLGLSRFLDQRQFQELFPDAIDLYKFDGLVNAAKRYTEFANTSDDTNDRLELAAFLAQTAHESDNFKAAEEYARDTYTVWQYCDNTTYPCAPGRSYYGRGPIQLSWNYNYFLAGRDLGLDLLNVPELVATDDTITWMTALWYWMTPQNGRVIHDVVTDVNGFSQSTAIINGGLECGSNAPNTANELQRIQYFMRFCEVLGVQPRGNTSCNA